MPDQQVNETEILWPEEAMPALADEPGGDVDASVAVAEIEENELPPERVGFVAPLNLRSEGSEVGKEGSVVNLSVRGMACLSPLDLDPGQRLWLTFRLNLAEKPLTLLGEVIWKEPPRHDRWPLGIRFKSLTRTEIEALRETVRERSEGRAGAWPLPIMETTAVASAPAAGRATPWLSAVAGMAAGIALALAVSMIPSTAVTGVSAAPAAGAPTGNAEVDAKTNMETNANVRANVDVPEASPPSPHSGARPALSGVEGGSGGVGVGSAGALSLVEGPARESTPERLPNVKTDVQANAKVPDAATSDLTVAGWRDSLTVMLKVDGPVGVHEGFWVENPRRYVVDVMQRKSALKQHAYDIDHPIASAVRVGSHRDRVRFVIDTPTKKPLVAVLEPTEHALRLTLRAK